MPVVICKVHRQHQMLVLALCIGEVIQNTKKRCTKLDGHFYRIMKYQHSKLWPHSYHRVNASLSNNIMEHYELHRLGIMYCMLTYMFLLCLPLNVEMQQF